MKMKITYEVADLKRLIRNNLAHQGITATDADIEFKKDQAIVSVEVTGEESDPATEAQASTPAPAPTTAQRNEHTHDVMTRPDIGRPPPTPTPAPKLEAVEGGANPVDMSDVFRQSQKIASTRDAPFPAPKHAMLDGESSEWPGEKP